MSNEKVDSKFEFEIYDLARVMNASSHLLLLVTSRIFPRVFHSVFCTHPPYIKHKQRFHLHNNWVPGVSFPSHCFEIQNSSSSSSDFWLSQTSLIYSHYLATKEIGSKIKKGTGIGFVNERGKISIIRAQRIGFIPDHVKPSFFASSLMPLRTFTFRISPKSTNNDSIILFLICGKIPLKLFTKRKSPFQCSDVYLVIQPVLNGNQVGLETVPQKFSDTDLDMNSFNFGIRHELPQNLRHEILSDILVTSGQNKNNS